MDKFIALNNQTIGRDKLARLIQYFSRAIWDSLERNDFNPAITDQFKTLEYILSSFRKLLRFGKCLDVFYSTLKTIHYPDLTIKFTLTFSKLAQALFLLCDHIVWLSRTGLFRNIDSRKWIEVSNKYWLLSIVMNLSRDIYEIFHLIDLHYGKGDYSKRSSSTKVVKETTKNTTGINLSNLYLSTMSCRLMRTNLNHLALHSFSLLYQHKEVAIDTVKNICDIFIPLTTLGYIKLTPRTVGILGVLSSIAGLIVVLDPSTRLLPS